MIDRNKFHYFVKRSGYTFAKFAAVLGMNETTLYRKLSGVSDFTRPEMAKIKTELNLTSAEFLSVFFIT